MNYNFLFDITAGSTSVNVVEQVSVTKTTTVWDMILSGGISGIVIIGFLFLLSIISIYIFAERSSAISQASKFDKNFLQNVKMLVSEGKIKQAKAICRRENNPTARILENAIDRINKPLNDVAAYIENSGSLEVFALEHNISRLAMIAGVGPMLGFLGTVIGMVMAFQQMATAGGQVEVQDLSGGISTAMLTTVAGLIVGIMAYIFYNVLVTRINSVVNQIEASTMEFIDMLSDSYNNGANQKNE